MTNTPNPGPGDRSPENPDRSSQGKSASSLLNEAIGKFFVGEKFDPNKAFSISPQKFKELKENTSALQNAVNEIKAYFQNNIDEQTRKGVGNLTREDIEKHMQKATIVSFIREHATPLAVRRKQLWNIINTDYQDILKEPDAERKIREMIGNLSAGDLNNLSGAHMRKAKLKELFPEYKKFEKRPHLGRIFEAVKNLGSDKEKDILRSIDSNYRKLGVAPSPENIQDLLKFYQNKDTSTKLDILKKLGIKINLGLAIRAGLISEGNVEGLLREMFGSIYDELDDEEKEKLYGYQIDTPDGRKVQSAGKIFESAEPLDIPIASLDANAIEQLFQDTFLSNTADAVIQSLLEHREPAPSQGAGILQKVKAMQESLYGEGCDYDIHTAFLEYMKENLKGPNSTAKIENIENYTPGSLLQVESEGTIFYYELLSEKSEETGETVVSIPVYNGDEIGIRVKPYYVEKVKGSSGEEYSVLKESDRREFSYDHLYKYLDSNTISGGKVVSKSDLESQVSKNGEDGKIVDMRGDELTIGRSLTTAIDKLDPAGVVYKFEEGTYFTAPATEDDTRIDSEIWKIHKVHKSSNTVDLMNSLGGIDKNIPIESLYNILKSAGSGFKRVDYIKDDAGFLESLVKSHGVHKDAKIQDGILKQEVEDPISQEKKNQEVRYFTNGTNRIRVAHMENGIVHFQEYSKDGGKDEKKKKKGKKDEQKPGYGDLKHMSYGMFLKFLEDNKLKSTTDTFGEDAKDTPKLNSKMHGSFWSKVFKMQSPMSMKMGIGNIVKSVKESLEKGATLDAARFSLTIGKYLPEFMKAPLYAKVVQGSREIFEKITKRLESMPSGPEVRKECIKIARNRDARPEEVMAAMMFILGSYGQFYAEDLRTEQSRVSEKNNREAPNGDYMFFDALVITLRLGDVKTKRQEMYLKAKAFLDQKDGPMEPIEEHMVHMLLKDIDKRGADIPYASSVMKAMGGPSKFGGVWTHEAYDKAIKKGQDDTSMLDASARNKKGVGYFQTNELYKLIGAMEKNLEKSQSPQNQIIPFLWCLGGFSQYISSEALQKLKNFSENAVSFHAYGFMRNKIHNDVYRDTVLLAVEDLATMGKLKGNKENIKSWIKNLDPQKNKDDYEEAISGLMKFWQDNQGNGLHDMLQGQNGWLASKSKSHPIISNYVSAWGVNTSSQTGENIKKEYGWYDEQGTVSSIIPDFAHEGGYILRSFRNNFKKIKISGHSAGQANIGDDEKIRLLDPVINVMNNQMKTTAFYFGNEDLKKIQYLQIRKEILEHIQKYAYTHTEREKYEKDDKRLLKTLYTSNDLFKSLRELGIHYDSLLSPELQQANANDDYKRWLDGKDPFGGQNTVEKQVDKVGESVNKALSRERESNVIDFDTEKRRRMRSANDDSYDSQRQTA